MKPKHLILLIGLVFISCKEQTPKSDYAATFEWVVETFSRNDAGFQYIVDQKGQEDYDRFTNGIREQVRNAKSERKFIEITNKWLHYFRKGHIGFTKNSGGDLYSYFFDKSQTEKKPDFETLHIKKLSDKTLYLRISSFAYENKQYIDSLLLANDYLIQSTPNLIIDIRDAIGGSDSSWGGLIKYIYTNPIISHNVQIRTSEANATTYEIYADKIKDSSLYKTAERIRKAKTDFIPLFETDSNVLTIDYYEPTKKPQHVGILINGRNASSDEEFLLTAKQSLKVKLFGNSTFGALDISNMTIAESPGKKFTLMYAMTKSNRIPDYCIDNVGIQPDYFIDKEVPAEEWVGLVQKTLEGY